MDNANYGINKEYGHPRAIELLPDEFFWNNFNQLTPFGSDQGDEALAEFRAWRKINSKSSLLNRLEIIINEIGEMDILDYNQSLLDEKLIKKQLKDEDFDFEQCIDELDISIIATGFGQFADEGTIDPKAKSIVKIALDRQCKMTYHGFYQDIDAQEYRRYLTRLLETLPKA
ncbi:MAG: hypothetical protein SFY56_14170 [Bacteroidota bacterium]|nr:hypothetical protein [Bacteroidota bacterium]